MTTKQPSTPTDGHLTPDWLRKKNWINKKRASSTEISDEMWDLYDRAFNLTEAQLDELIHLVGIKYYVPKGEYATKEEYVYLLFEADDIKKVYDYLDKHGV
jgi:hypothetical protein